MSEFDPLVDCAWLAQRLDAPDICIVDATWFMPADPRDAKALYAESRIPGAVFFDIDDIADTETALPHMLPRPEKFASRVRKLGIGDGVRIIVYDRVGIFSAPRVWWTFRVMGHDDVAVLDGGLPAWEAAGYAVDREPPRAPRERHFTSHYRGDLVRDLDDVRRAAAAGKPILDARPQARFRGEAPEPRAGLRSGHIPGSANLPSASLLTDDGRLLPTPALRQALGPYLEGERPITTCGSGVSAAIIALALAAVGRTDAAIYDGSWSEWGARADTPIATDVESGA